MKYQQNYKCTYNVLTIEQRSVKMNRSDSVNAGKGWHECASWLTRCGALRADHKANWPQATAFDLAYTLRDGVLLCNLLNIVDPGCIDMKDVNQKPQYKSVLISVLKCFWSLRFGTLRAVYAIRSF